MTSGRIAVLCPTRDRPKQFKRLVESVCDTAKNARVLAYVDEDQAELYGDVHPALLTVGDRVGPVAACNLMADRYRGYDVYGMVTDDSVLTTPGWDEWCLDVVKQFPNRICCVSPNHNNGSHVDMPFVTRQWIDTTGWYACPAMWHYAWPTVTSLIGEMTAIVHAPPHKFRIEHDYVDGTYPERRAADNTAFYDYVSLRLPSIVEKVREAMS
jgi:hypothetical protein